MTPNGTPALDPQIPMQAAAGRFGRFMQIAQMKPPSYVDARNFSTAMWHTIADRYPTAIRDAVNALAAPPPAGQPPAAPAANTDGSVALAQLAIAAPPKVLAALEKTVALVPSEMLRAQLTALLSEAGDDYTKLLAATDGWFNAQMDRVSGWYKRETMWIMAAIAVVVVSLTGVDSVAIVRLLSTSDPNALAALANTVQSNVTQSNGAVSSTFDVTTFVHPITDAASAGNWGYHNGTYYRWPGLVATFLALLLGGPFWFQALQSLANVRSAGRKPKRSDQPPQ